MCVCVGGGGILFCGLFILTRLRTSAGRVGIDGQDKYVCLYICFSVAMTTIAVVLALGVMPLNLWIYTRYWEELAVAIPYRNLLITLTVTTVPAGLGYLVSWRLPKAGLILAKVMGMSNWDNLRFILSYWLLSLLVFTLQSEALYRGDGPAFVRRLSVHYFTFPETAAWVKVKYYGKLPRCCMKI